MPTHAIEELAYEVIGRIGGVELRRYAPYVVAEILMTGSATEAGNKAFRILASYIFGKNRGEKKLAMTAPVRPGWGMDRTSVLIRTDIL